MRMRSGAGVLNRRHWKPAALFLFALSRVSGDAQIVTGGTISGTVLDSAGVPLAGATVSLLVELGGPSTPTTTDDQGRFELSRLQPGRYRVEVTKIDYVRQQFGEKEKRTPGLGATIVLTPSAPDAEIQVVLDHGARITGTVHDEQGNPVARGYVFFVDDPDPPSRAFHVRTDLNGMYRALDLPAGNYYVSAARFSEQANQVVGDYWYFPGVVTFWTRDLAGFGECAVYP